MTKKIVLLLLIAATIVGCASKKDVIYFQDLAEEGVPQPDSTMRYPKIQVNDILKIDVTALNPDAVIPFQFEKTVSMQGNKSLEIMQLEGYVVREDGQINFPILGDIEAQGLTTREFQKKMEELLSVYIKDASVKVRLLNFKVTILGEVNNPGTISLTEESVTLPQALGKVGDLTINGQRENILIIRTVDGKRETKRIDMTQSDWMDSPYYFLKQNDFIYVAPNAPKVASSGFVGNVGTLLSVVSILLTVVVLLSR